MSEIDSNPFADPEAVNPFAVIYSNDILIILSLPRNNKHNCTFLFRATELYLLLLISYAFLV